MRRRLRQLQRRFWELWVELTAPYRIPFFKSRHYVLKKTCGDAQTIQDELRKLNRGFRRPEVPGWRDVYYPVADYGVKEYLAERHATKLMYEQKPSLGLDE